MKRIFSILGLVALAALVAQAQLTFGINDLLGVKRVGDPQLSPDGKWVAFTVGTVNKDAKKVDNQIYIVRFDGSKQRQITNRASSSASPPSTLYGKRIAFPTVNQA